MEVDLDVVVAVDQGGDVNMALSTMPRLVVGEHRRPDFHELDVVFEL